jgi:hypothetical protein
VAKKCPAITIVLFIAFIPTAFGGHPDILRLKGYLLEQNLWHALLQEYSGERAAKHIQELSRFHRIAGG